MRRIRTLLLHACSDANATFSYQVAWPRQFRRHSAFRCTAINVADRAWHARLRGNALARLWRGDLIVILHSVFSNSPLLAGRLFDAVRALPQPKIYFIGNEYKFMPEKMQFCEDLGVALLVSQSTSPAVHALYRERLGCLVTGLPNTGLDPELFQPMTPPDQRPIDLGYRADDVPAYLGHNERRELAEFFVSHANKYHLSVDISLEAEDRLGERDWASFLNRCRGQLGSEAGGDYFALDDDQRVRVNAYVRDHPTATLRDLHDKFFRESPKGVPLRILSGRHVEAAGTKTVQILFEGYYDGYLHADEHYIPLKKDFSNADEAIEKFRDRALCSRLVDNAYRLATTELTYPRLLERFRVAVQPLVRAPAVAR
jgi:hypothetical protein